MLTKKRVNIGDFWDNKVLKINFGVFDGLWIYGWIGAGGMSILNEDCGNGR